MKVASILDAEPGRLAELRGVLMETGFTPERILETIAAKDSAPIKESDLLLLTHRTAAATPLNTLIRILLIQTGTRNAAHWF